MKRVLCVVLMLAGKSWGGCVGEDCWPFEIEFTGYVIEEVELPTAPDCPPATIALNWWGGQDPGEPYGEWRGGGYWIDFSLADESWIWTATREAIAATAQEDGLATVSYDYMIQRPDGQGGFLSPALAFIELKPTSNVIGFVVDDCSYGMRNLPYAVSGMQVMGDSNFDGLFDSGDLVSVFVAGKYETGEVATWQEGDWSVDRRFDSADFVAALTYGNYEQSAVAAVPEPSTLWLLSIGLILQYRLSRRSNAAVKHVV